MGPTQLGGNAGDLKSGRKFGHPERYRRRPAGDPRCGGFPYSPSRNRNRLPDWRVAASIQPSGGDQFLRGDNCEFLAKLGTKHVLATIAACERKIRGTVTPTSHQIGEELVVFIAGMGGDEQRATQLAEAARFPAGRRQTT